MKISPKRITIALDVRGLYGPEVDVACGGVEPMVDEWEAGTRVPTEDQLARLAALTGYPVTFFYLPDPTPAVGFYCVRSGKGKGCYVVDERPDAEVKPLHGQGALW